MKKKHWITVGIVLAVLLIGVLLLSGSFRRITVVSGAQFIDRCPRLARPGQEVTVTTAVVSDGEIYVNGRIKKPESGKALFLLPRAGEFDCMLGEIVDGDPDNAFILAKHQYCMK